MKHFGIIATAMAIVCLSCEKIGVDAPVDNPYKALDLTTKSADFADKGNTFAFEFLDRINSAEKGDFFVSPLSMQFLLGMILDGAQGQTADEICKVLGYGAGETSAVNEYCLSMLEQLPSLDRKTKLSIANALFVNKKYPLLDDYKKTVGKYYQAEVSNLDFGNTATLRTINNWCSKKTDGLIPKVLDNVSSTMLAYILNAMYFKSEWTEKFKKSDTSDEPFFNGSERVTVKMMKQRNNYLCHETDVYSVVRMPYGNGAYSMYAFLPYDGYTITDVIAALKDNEWDKMRGEMVSCNVDLWLPRFETRYHVVLNDILSAMGMPSSFNNNADFQKMSNNAFRLSFIKQDAVIKVDEEGSEAAVVSMAGMDTAFLPGQHVVFHADHPFLYLIAESSTGTILFAGKYSG